MSLSVEPGELVAIAGGSGAGKSTLLEILAGLQSPSVGEVRHDGVGRGAGVSADSRIGYVPQDDIIHLEMPLRRTLRYAARLRLPAGTSVAEADRVVEETMHDLDLADHAEVPVRALSGGQPKRASIAVELLTRPRLFFFLDEPTSGLDPSTAADVMRLLRRLSQHGVTVVLTTHEPAGIDRCDRVVFLARDGHLAFTGSPTEARRYFGVDDLAEVYDRLAGEHTPQILGRSDSRTAVRGRRPRPAWLFLPVQTARSDLKHTGVIRQWWLLHTAQCQHSGPQPAKPSHARLTRAGHGDDGDAVQARRFGSKSSRPGPGDCLDRIRRLLFRPYLWPAPPRWGDGSCSGESAWSASAWAPTWHPRSQHCFRYWPE